VALAAVICKLEWLKTFVNIKHLTNIILLKRKKSILVETMNMEVTIISKFIVWI